MPVPPVGEEEEVEALAAVVEALILKTQRVDKSYEWDDLL